MKIKPTRHKETNTFKFVPFSERINNLHIDVFHYVSCYPEENESSTFMQQAIDKWTVDNGTLAMEKILRELPATNSLPLLIHNKQQIIEIVLKYLELHDSLILQPVLELLVAVARDLRKEFYPYFGRSLKCIFDLISVSRDPEVLEWSFQCLAYLLKFLWKNLLREPAGLVFEYALPLLSDNRPGYIKEFAAQCFAFVARKVKDKPAFLLAVLEKIREEDAEYEGAARLFCETLCGVSGTLHSTAPSFLHLLLSSLGNDDDYPTQTLALVLSFCLQYLTRKIKPGNWQPFWDNVTVVLHDFQKNKNTKGIETLLNLNLIPIEVFGGRFVSNPGQLITALLPFLSLEWSEDVIMAGVKCAAHLISGKNVALTQEHSAVLCAQVMDLKDFELITKFIDISLESPSFEIHILHKFLKLLQTESASHCNARSFLYLSKIILKKSPPCHSGAELQHWQSYPVDLGRAVSKTLLRAFIADSDYQLMLAVSLIAPHVTGLDYKDVLVTYISNLCYDVLSSSKPDQDLVKLSLVVEAAVHLKLNFDTLISDILKVVFVFKNKLSSLRILDLIVTAKGRKDEQLFKKLMDEKLYLNLSSPFHKIRALTCHIFSILEQGTLFQHFLDIELIPATIDQYRDKLNKIGGLEPLSLAATHPEPFAQELALRFLISQLYENFKLLWEPISTTIALHADSQLPTLFWTVYTEQLRFAAAKIQSGETASNTAVDSIEELKATHLQEFYSDLESQNNTPDFVNFRCLLWNTLTLFSEQCEAKSKDLVPLYLDFLSEEYYKSEASDDYLWDVRKPASEGPEEDNAEEIPEGTSGIKENPEDTAETEETAEVTEEIPDVIDEHEETPEVTEEIPDFINEPEETPEFMDETEDGGESTREKRRKSKHVTRSLVAHLQLFAKLRNPKALYREPELRASYDEFLKHRSSQVQKLALECVLHYRHPSLLPYREQLQGLLEDKTFRVHLVKFNVGEEGDAVQPAHRDALIPVLMSILYSKMQGKGSKHRATIFRFLSGCREEELLTFLRLAFKNHLEEGPLLHMVTRVIASTDLTKVMPAKRLSSTVALAVTVLTHLGRYEEGMQRCLELLLRVLLLVAARVAGVFTRRAEVAKFAVGALSATRKVVLEALGKLFARGYETAGAYPWTAAELDAVFAASVWPYLAQLPHESALTPTALLRLFGVWTQDPRLFPLLAKHREDDPEATPLAFVVKLLCAEKTRNNVCTSVLQFCERLLTLVPDEDDVALQVNHLQPAAENTQVDRAQHELNYGSTLLLRHVPSLLGYLHRRTSLAASRHRGGLGPLELLVLSRVSEMVTDPITASSLCELLVPLCVKKAQRGAGDAALQPMLNTVHNLLGNVQDAALVYQLIPLFSTASGRQSRLLLCKIMSRVHPSASECKLFESLNSMDKVRFDEPNFSRRIGAFSKITSLDDLDLQFGLIVMHNCYHTIKNEKDMSLRDCAAHCLQVVCPKLAIKFYDDPKTRTLVLERTIMDILRRGVRDKNEVVQHEALGLLGVMARKCPQVHSVLRDLQHLACESDLETDFFENMRHLQLHRRSRALLKFAQVAKETEMRPLTLTQFILPLASAFLCNEKYAKVNSLIDAAIDAVGAVCSQLPWQQYEAVLKLHLSRLPRMYDYQKQLVRTLVAILDAFHFDLSECAEPVKKTARIIPAVAEKMDTDDQIVPEGDQIVPDAEKPMEGSAEVFTPEEEGTEVTSVEKEEQELQTILECSTDEPAATRRALKPQEAAKIRHAILRGLLPRLQGAISAHAPAAHKLSSRDPKEEREREAQEVLRVPLALAIVKLLQKLPHGALQQNLAGVLSKVGVFLRSRLESTRRAARDVLQEMLRTLGAAHLRVILSELSALLTRGYQVHVLVFTVHALLVTASGMPLQSGDVDPCLQDVLNVCKADLFGDAAEEKEVAQVAGRVVEARSHKSYDTLYLLARFTSERCLTDLLVPLRDVIKGSHSYKLVKRVAACLQQIVQGLAENVFVAADSLLTFAYGAASESLPALTLHQATPSVAKKPIDRPDTFLIESAPKRSGPVSKKSTNTHAHQFVAFGLQLLHFLLKRERAGNAAMLDPYIEILVQSLRSQHTKLVTLALNCLSWLLKMDLPSAKKRVVEITEEVFKLLHKFAGSGQNKGETFDLSNAAFKVVSVTLRDVAYHDLSSQQVRLVLLYAERDVQAAGDSARQATAFTLLRAVLKRRLHPPELQGVMRTVLELAVTSETQHVRQNCRQIALHYLLEYRFGKKVLEELVTFVLSQLSFALTSGRLSALELLQGLTTHLKVEQLDELAGLVFVLSAARLVNDEAPECRQSVAALLRNLLLKASHNKREELFGATLLWLKDDKPIHRRLAVQLCGLFLSVEGSRFEARLATLLELVLRDVCDMRPGRFVRAPQEDLEGGGAGTPRDHLTFQALRFLLQLSAALPAWLATFRSEAQRLAAELQPLLNHAHAWVRLAAAQLFGCVFGAMEPAAVAAAVASDEDHPELLFFCEDASRRLKSLTLDLCEQLQDDVAPEMAQQVIKNLVYIARVLRYVERPDLSLLWLAKRLRRPVNQEVARAPANSVLRSAVLKWCAGVTLELGAELADRQPLLHHVLAPVAREVADNAQAPPTLKKLAKEVAALMKEQIGVENFAVAMSKLRGKMTERRENRKRKLAQEVIIDPERSAQRKIRKQQVKKVAKKRKIDDRKGRKRKNFRDNEESLEF